MRCEDLSDRYSGDDGFDIDDLISGKDDFEEEDDGDVMVIDDDEDIDSILDAAGCGRL